MSSAVKQPIGQKRLTNVAVVRYKKFGKKFEVACYKNKVVNWRNGVEKDLDEVLQTTTVFSNVSKAVVAKDEALVEVFGTSDERAVCLKILAEGETQISDKERELEFSNLFRDVASILAEKCINPETHRPYTMSMVERLLRDIHFSVDPKRNAKQQALAVLPHLKERFPIERARMRLKLQVPLASKDELMDLLRSQHAAIESEDLTFDGTQVAVVCLADPGSFRSLHALVQQCGGGRGRLEVASLAATEDSGTTVQTDASGIHKPPRLPQMPTGPTYANWMSQPQHAHEQSGSHAQADHVGDTAAASSTGRNVVNTLGTPSMQKGAKFDVVYPRGPIAGMPDEFASRRDRFAEVDELQPGWQVELKRQGRSDTLDAIFFSPDGKSVGAFVNARRAALAAHNSVAA